MRVPGPRRWIWAAAGGGLAVTLTASFLALDAATRNLVEESYGSATQASQRLVALHLQSGLESTAEELREIAVRCADDPSGPAEACLGELARARTRRPRLVLGGFVADPGGSVLNTDPPRSWRQPEGSALAAAARSAIANRSTAVAATPGGEAGALVFLAVPVAAGRVGAIGLALDGGQLARTALAALVHGGPGVGFLVTEEGALIASAGPAPLPAPSVLARLFGTGASDAGRASAPPVRATNRWKGHLDGAREEVVGTAAPVKVFGSVWFVGVIVPARWVTRGFAPLLLGGALLITALVAGAVVAVAGWRGKDRSESAARRDAERWRQVAERRQREGRWRGLADHAPCPLLSLLGTQVVAANQPAVDALAGGSRNRLIGMDFLSFVEDRDRGRLAEFLTTRMEMKGRREATAVHLVSRDDRRLVVEMRAVAVAELDETLLYLSWEAGGPQLAEALLETVGRETPMALVFTDPSGLVRWVNGAFAARTGLDPAGLVGRPMLGLVEPAQRRAVLAALARARRGRRSAGQVTIRCASGEPVAADFQAFPVASSGATIGSLFVASETGGVPGVGPEFPRAARDRAVSLLGTALSHRLSNTFQALLGVLDGLAADEPPHRSVEQAQRLVAGGVEDLRRFVAVSRSGSGSRRPVQLAPLLERWVGEAAGGLPPSVRLTLRCEATDDRVVADAAQLALWLDVTLGAAVAAMERGEGAVEVSLMPGRRRGSVRIAVADTGLAVPGPSERTDADRDRLGSRETARALGEVIAIGHGGQSGGRARTGIGGRLWVELPCGPAPAPARWPVRRAGAVLLADDEEMVRTTLAEALREVGHEVVEASNGLEAVEKVLAAPEKFALVVLDIVMPVMDGREALRRLNEQAPGVPVAVCTGYDPVGDDALSAAGLLRKPFSIGEFVTRISELLGEVPPARPDGGTMTS